MCIDAKTHSQVVNAKGRPHSTGMWDEMLAINLSGTFHLTRLAMKHLIHVSPEEGPDGERGVVLMISSNAAVGGVSLSLLSLSSFMALPLLFIQNTTLVRRPTGTNRLLSYQRRNS